MADSVDRVFVHALNTVKKIPRTGSARPPPADRLRLYGLYKQAMEGDVDGVMDRPRSAPHNRDDSDEAIREQEKWDAWDSQKGLSRTEAKRRYIEALIETMHKYASTTADARELVAELEFVWDQIKNNSVSNSSNSSPGRDRGLFSEPRRFQRPQSGSDGPMKVLSPMSQDDEDEIKAERKMEHEEQAVVEGEEFKDDEYDGLDKEKRRVKRWRRKVEATLLKMTAEMAALREQIETGRDWRIRRQQSLGAWLGWLIWVALRHFLLDAILMGLVLLWMRKRKDRRLEDLVRQALRLGREYIRKLLPPR